MKEWLTTSSKEELSDEEIFQSSQNRPELFGLLLDRYQEAFFRKAYSILKNEGEAEDVVSETFTKIYLKSHLFKSEGDGSFKSWGYRVLINTALTYYQKKKRENTARIPEEFEEIFPDLNMIERKEQREAADYISSVLVRMPDSLAKVLSKFFLEGKSQEEIAKEEGTSVGAIKTKVFRAKEAFRKIQSSVNL